MACAHSVDSVSPQRARRGGVVSLLVVAALSAATPWAGAAIIPLTNPGFETAGSGTIIGTANGSGIPGWVADATGVTLVGDESVTVAEDPSPAIGYTGGYTGSQVGLFYWSGPDQSDHASGTITVTQTLTGTPALPNTTYTLQVDIGYRDDQGVGAYTDTLPDPETIQIEVLAGGVELASPVRVSPSPVYRNFVTYSVTYTTGATAPVGDLGVEILGTRANTTGSNVPLPTSTYNPQGHDVLGEAFLPFDNVRLDATPLPEPSSLAAMVLGVVLPLTRRRRSAC